MSNFKWTKEETPDGLVIAFEGKLDDESNLSEIDLGLHKNVFIDLSGVRLINSLGIRQWILWWGSKLKDRNVKLRACPKVIIDQANIVNSFFPSGSVVESLFVPYSCDDCDETTNVLLESGKDFTAASADAPEKVSLPESIACPKCSKTMEVDVDESKYFRFLKRI